ncbi:hypothetical protein Q4519_13705 [Motilimonas sp. 1_MG-2023]|uniref:hypothetical protein n=1 Tax=Motilimonas sp. 1_MG-2023 TaxID=3062672 RepID=UPI0026E2166D|nr:hypothetical protein [Motilimonas sp. 1_MG-2023]MDO6526742.1 hypothetical protein [Motilimonas sp. 1_MG-2023]
MSAPAKSVRTIKRRYWGILALLLVAILSYMAIMILQDPLADDEKIIAIPFFALAALALFLGSYGYSDTLIEFRTNTLTHSTGFFGPRRSKKVTIKRPHHVEVALRQVDSGEVNSKKSYYIVSLVNDERTDINKFYSVTPARALGRELSQGFKIRLRDYTVKTYKK